MTASLQTHRSICASRLLLHTCTRGLKVQGSADWTTECKHEHKQPQSWQTDGDVYYSWFNRHTPNIPLSPAEHQWQWSSTQCACGCVRMGACVCVISSSLRVVTQMKSSLLSGPWLAAAQIVIRRSSAELHQLELSAVEQNHQRVPSCSAAIPEAALSALRSSYRQTWAATRLGCAGKGFELQQSAVLRKSSVWFLMLSWYAQEPEYVNVLVTKNPLSASHLFFLLFIKPKASVAQTDSRTLFQTGGAVIFWGWNQTSQNLETRRSSQWSSTDVHMLLSQASFQHSLQFLWGTPSKPDMNTNLHTKINYI